MGYRVQGLELPEMWADRVRVDSSQICPSSQQAQALRLSAVLRCIPGKIDHKRLNWVLAQFKSLKLETLSVVFVAALADARIRWTAAAEESARFLCWGGGFAQGPKPDPEPVL